MTDHKLHAESPATPTLEIDRRALCRELGLDPDQITEITINVDNRTVMVTWSGARKITDEELHRVIAAATFEAGQ